MRLLKASLTAFLSLIFFYLLYDQDFKSELSFLTISLSIIYGLLGILFLLAVCAHYFEYKEEKKFFSLLKVNGINLNEDENKWWKDKPKFDLIGTYTLENSRLEYAQKIFSKNELQISNFSLDDIKEKIIKIENTLINEFQELSSVDKWWSFNERFKKLTESSTFRDIIRKYCNDNLLNDDKSELNSFQRYIDIKQNIKNKIEENEIKEEKKKIEEEKQKVINEKKEEEKRIQRGNISKRDEKPFCSWCGEGSSRLNYIDWNKIEEYWHYRNKDGTKDKRAKDNYLWINYNTEWKCSYCEAEIIATHFVGKKPKKLEKIWKVDLKKEGKGNRMSSDWISDKGTTVTRSHHKQDD